MHFHDCKYSKQCAKHLYNEHSYDKYYYGTLDTVCDLRLALNLLCYIYMYTAYRNQLYMGKNTWYMVHCIYTAHIYCTFADPIEHVNNIPTMQPSTGISRNTKSKSFVLSLNVSA
mgnify:FL=1